TQATTVLVMAKVGSRYEPPELSGASHFIEHMMFKGTRRHPTPSDVSRALDAIGADFNAYTSKEYTGYYVKADASHERFAIDMLHAMTFDALYNQEEMDRERRVIIEEINMYEDTPVRHIDELLERVMFKGNALARDIAGTPETMRTMLREDVMAFRDRHYVPSRMTIAVAGKVDTRTVEWLDATFGEVKGSDASDGYEAFAGFPAHDVAPVEMQQKTTEQMHIGIGFPGLAVRDTRREAMRVLSTILGGNMSSRLFMSVREQGGLAYRIVADHSSCEDTGALTILAGLDKTRLSEAMDRTFAEIRSLVERGPTEEEMTRSKDFLRGKMMLAMEDSSNRAEWYARQALFLGTVPTPEEHIEHLRAVTTPDVHTLAREVFDGSRMCLSYIGTETDPDVIRASIPT
ncbi:MAG: pitrilysin family protein, partial [Patescibacteria group bacterium]